ncbi:MAG: hypothetical protein E7042_06190 [Lentisphaerae bacterium]|nr:hypothetical protein [Lentisphaerota bacterium]
MKKFAGIIMLSSVMLSASVQGFPLQALFEKIHSSPAPAEWRPSGIDRNIYLDMMEPIVRNAAKWVDERGAVIDPVIKREWNQTSCRFASPAAILLKSGRIPDLKETVFRVMDYCCDKLPQLRRKESPDFWMRELTTAIYALENIAPAERLARWRNALAKVEPEVVYFRVKPDHRDLHTLGNWVVYSSCGESMRESIGIGGGEWLWGNRFFETYITAQIANFDDNGLYRDPRDPFTYDFTTRLQVAAALSFGYKGKLAEKLSKILDNGAKTTLLYMPPQAVAPFGGRSALFNFQEGIIAALCEYHANIYKSRDPELAGAFKRQAHLSAAAVQKHFAGKEQPFHIKNRFHIDSRHGCDSYGHYSVYSLYAASVMGMAALWADDTIAERPCPSEKGNYSFAMTDSFYKVFGNAHGHALEFNFSDDFFNDSVGLGRILLKGAEYAVLPVLPFTATPKYVTGDVGLRKNCSITASWKDEQNNTVNAADNPGRWMFRSGNDGDFTVNQYYQGCTIVWDCRFDEKGVTVTILLEGKYHDGKITLPLLENNGEKIYSGKLDGTSIDIANVNIENLTGIPIRPTDVRLVNRSGIYRLYNIPLNKDGAAVLRFSVK